MQNLQKSNLKDVKLIPEEMLIPAEDGRDLPSGACCWALNSKFTL
jgi:hypothetical protein